MAAPPPPRSIAARASGHVGAVVAGCIAAISDITGHPAGYELTLYAVGGATALKALGASLDERMYMDAEKGDGPLPTGRRVALAAGRGAFSSTVEFGAGYLAVRAVHVACKFLPEMYS
jgi:hypothetical protein